jgi:PAS domain S-box-containing protein
MKLSMAVEGASDWVLITDKNGTIEYVNSAIERMSGYQKEELIGQKPSIFKSDNHNELFYNELWETILSGRTFMAIISNRKKDGGLFDVFHTITPLKDSSGAITHFISTAKDMTAQKLLEEKIHNLAYYDELTGLPNRAFHLELMARAIEHAKRYGQKFGVLCIDLDNFKRINDSLGLSIGDMLLKTMADRLTSFLRNSDFTARSGQDETVEVLYRMGGDEFLVMLQNIGGQDAARVADRLLRELSRPCILNGRDVFITASIGISLYPDDGDDIDDLLKNADAAMYQAKEKGRNNYQFYSKSLSASVLEALTVENELRRAIDLDQFVLYYQPKLDASTRTICGMEALIRWFHPEKGMIMPGRFIPLAETSDLILPIGEFSLRTACQQVKLWQDSGFKPMNVAVNVSGRQFSQTNLIDVVNDALQFSGISPQYLDLEITEGTIMRNPEEAIRTLHILKDMGIQIAIDDFGTGYSSLNYLKQLPLDFLKIDQSFVRNVSSSHSDRAIIRAVIAMAHSLNLKVIAEGVETQEQLDFLRMHECDEMQGYLFSQPVAAEAFSELLKRGSL